MKEGKKSRKILIRMQLLDENKKVSFNAGLLIQEGIGVSGWKCVFPAAVSRENLESTFLMKKGAL